jgi:sulfur carrier protein
MRVTLNGADRELEEGATVADAATLVGVQPDEPGVAVALADGVVPRARWRTTRVREGARVEIVRATAGG